MIPAILSVQYRIHHFRIPFPFARLGQRVCLSEEVAHHNVSVGDGGLYKGSIESAHRHDNVRSVNRLPTRLQRVVRLGRENVKYKTSTSD